ncbi:MAG: hypothetical protein A3D28_00985 [Omnitrophica bacterium RIFCSPHIGHO2_02_FULL_63_14]|nr:MAG: hypothetical protein A3D28_00985 [Omnitrophica bacterium RIFCSPHIGHO2_02_FULL_63_14]
MKRSLLAVGVLWIVILAGVVGMKEFTLRTGKEVLLQTVPVDPRDMFRGDYVILSYPISTVDVTPFGLKGTEFSPGQEAYVLLGSEGPYSVVTGLQRRRPDPGILCIKGTVRTASPTQLIMEYGIESYFVPEGKGHALEQARGKTMDVKASIDKFGHAAIKTLLIGGQEVRFK